jgi:hypothetical protein
MERTLVFAKTVLRTAIAAAIAAGVAYLWAPNVNEASPNILPLVPIVILLGGLSADVRLAATAIPLAS